MTFSEGIVLQAIRNKAIEIKNHNEASTSVEDLADRIIELADQSLEKARKDAL